MRPFAFLGLALLFVSACATPAPTPVAPPSTPAPPPVVAEESVAYSVKVTASSLNVRSEPSADGELLAQVKKGTALGAVREENGWVRVRLADGTLGWVAERFVERAGAKSAKKSKSKCPVDSDFAFTETPTLAFSESGAHGLVVVDATVSTKGQVTSTKVLSNSTGDEALAFLAEREIKSARFDPPIRDCVPRAFVFTYRRTF